MCRCADLVFRDAGKRVFEASARSPRRSGIEKIEEQADGSRMPAICSGTVGSSIIFRKRNWRLRVSVRLGLGGNKRKPIALPPESRVIANGKH